MNPINALRGSLISVGMAKAALAAGDLNKAVKYSNQMLETAGERENSFTKGDYTYNGNIILGLVSVQKGDLDSADTYLLKAAGETLNAARINVFPDMSLARVLLSNGHRDTVLAFLKKCREFPNKPNYVGQWVKRWNKAKRLILIKCSVIRNG